MGEKDVDYKDAFWAATLGGARALGLDTVLGNFEVGKQFDAVRINCEAGNYDTFPSAIHPCCPSRLEHDFEKFVNLGDDRNIASVYVQGKRRRAPLPSPLSARPPHHPLFQERHNKRAMTDTGAGEVG